MKGALKAGPAHILAGGVQPGPRRVPEPKFHDSRKRRAGVAGEGA